MCNVAFCIPYYSGSNHSQFLGVGYLSSYLKKLGHETIILDEDAVCWVKSKTGSINPNEDARLWIKENIDEFNPHIICVSINTTNYQNGLLLLRYLRKTYPKKIIVVGGPHISVCWQTFAKLHRNLFDIGIVGEGEEALAEICRAIKDKKDFLDIPGVFISDKLKNMPRIINIDSLPFPDRDGFLAPFKNEEIITANKHYQRCFYSFLPEFRGKKHARIVATRGCNKQCGFCSPAVYWIDHTRGNPLRRIRTPRSIVEEIDELVQQGITAIYFDDPSFPVLSNMDFFLGFKLELKKRNINIVWGSPLSSDELSEDVLEALSETGFRYTYIGLESYNDANLLSLSKKQSIEHCIRMVDACNEKGIHCDISYQVGLPGEKLENIEKSLDWLVQHGLKKRVFFNITALWPGTILAKKYNITPLDYEPDINKEGLTSRGLYYFGAENNLDEYFSNCSGTFHFISREIAIEVKEILHEKGFCDRFDLTDEEYNDIAML